MMASLPTDAAAMPLHLLLSAIPSLPRPLLSRLTERLIDHLDSLDSWSDDLEDDDPAGDALDEKGEDEPHRPEGFALPKPLYAIDQSTGPINERDVHRAWRSHMRSS